MAWKDEGSLTLAGVDQLSLMGLGHEDIKEKKTNRVMGRERTRVSYLFSEWYSQGQHPQLVLSRYHHHCRHTSVMLHWGRYQ